MNRITLALVSSALALMASWCGAASAQDRPMPPPGARPAVDPRERWERMSPEERARLRERFDRWKQLPPGQQRELLERHHALRRTREEALRRLLPPEREHLKNLPPDARRRFLESRVEQLLPETRHELERSQDGRSPERIPFRELRSAIRGYASERLREFEREGVLSPGEAEHLLTLAPWQLPDEIRALRKRDLLANPPPAYRSLPPEERARIAELPPEAFLGEVKRLGGGPRDGEPHRPMRDAFDRARRHGRDGQGGNGGPRAFLPRQIAERLTPEQISQIEAARGRERGQLLGEFLRAHARAALERRGEDPGQVDRLGGLEGFERDRRLLKLIDPNAELPPPPPGRMDGGPQGGPPGPDDGKNARDERGPPDRRPDQRWD